MQNELSQLCPIQFIEGINENEELAEYESPSFHNKCAAIGYTPSISYNLTGIEIYVSWVYTDKPNKKHSVRIYTDHNDKPSKTCLVEGDLALPDNESSGWIPVKLVQSIVLIVNRQYWITFELRGVKLAVCIAAEGKKLKLKWSSFGDTWLPYEPEHRCMLKFFGRVLPTTGNLAVASSEGNNSNQ